MHGGGLFVCLCFHGQQLCSLFLGALQLRFHFVESYSISTLAMGDTEKLPLKLVDLPAKHGVFHLELAGPFPAVGVGLAEQKQNERNPDG
jgi:hypothetical protein